MNKSMIGEPFVQYKVCCFHRSSSFNWRRRKVQFVSSPNFTTSKVFIRRARCKEP